jgi:site-specific DNA recombinase
LRAPTPRETLPAPARVERRPVPNKVKAMRTVIYARFSSDNQNPLSTADQITMCRERASREGWTVVAAFEDNAISGAAGIGPDQRPGLHAMLSLVEAGGVDQVLAESTDRVARHVGDAHAVRERIEYAGARLFTLFDGQVTPIVGLVKGFMDAQFRSDLGQRIRRGARGALAQGRHPSSVAYGYRRVMRFDERGEQVRGLREIDPDQAAIVRRIFAETAAGHSTQTICRRLNAEGVPGPRGGSWLVCTLRGGPKWSAAILRNPIYKGVMVYGRSKQVRNPITRKRLMKPSGEPPIEQSVPHLRILEDSLWQAVQDKLAEAHGVRPERMRRPKHLLSGLGVCGVCGGPWNKISGDFWGCGRRFAAGRSDAVCPNKRLINSREFERRVLADLKGQMLDPEAVAAYVREYTVEYARQTQSLARDRGRIDRQLAEAQRKVERLTRAVADGGSEFAEIRAALTAASDDRKRLERELANMDALPVLALHPGLADRYREEIEQLEVALSGHEHAAIEAVPRLRAMIARIVLTPSNKSRGVALHVVRHLDEVLTFATRAQLR